MDVKAVRLDPAEWPGPTGWLECGDEEEPDYIELRYPEGYDPGAATAGDPGHPFAAIGDAAARELFELNFYDRARRRWAVPLEEVARKLGVTRQTAAARLKAPAGLSGEEADALCRAFGLTGAEHLLTGRSLFKKSYDEHEEALAREARATVDRLALDRLMKFAVLFESLPDPYRFALEDAAKGYALLLSGGDPGRLAEMGDRGVRRACELVTEGWEYSGWGRDLYPGYVKSPRFPQESL